MKDQDKLLEKKLQLYMQQSREEAPEGFSARLMEVLPQQQQALPQRIFKPLLSFKALAAMVALLALAGWLSAEFLQASKMEIPAWLNYRLPEFSIPAIDGTLLTIVLITIVLLAGLDHFLKRSLGSR